MRKLYKLRVTDEHGVMSLTNVALIASVLKATLMPHATFVEFTIVAACLASYQFKRWLQSRQTNESKYEQRIVSVENALNMLKSAITLKR